MTTADAVQGKRQRAYETRVKRPLLMQSTSERPVDLRFRRRYWGSETFPIQMRRVVLPSPGPGGAALIRADQRRRYREVV